MATSACTAGRIGEAKVQLGVGPTYVHGDESQILKVLCFGRMEAPSAWAAFPQ